MGNLFYIITVILIIELATGFIGYSVGGLFHILPVIAIVAVFPRLMGGRKVFFNNHLTVII
jgi:hypothetical protein